MLLTARLKGVLATACGQYLPQLVLLYCFANLADVDFLIGLGTETNANALHRGSRTASQQPFLCARCHCVWRIAGSFGAAPFSIFRHTAHIFSLTCAPGPSSDGTPAPLAFSVLAWAKEFRSPWCWLWWLVTKTFLPIQHEKCLVDLYEL